MLLHFFFNVKKNFLNWELRGNEEEQLPVVRRNLRMAETKRGDSEDVLLCIKNGLLQPLWKTVCRFLKKLKLEVTFDLAVQLPHLYTHTHTHIYIYIQNYNLKRYMQSYVHSRTIYNNQNMKYP